MQKTACWAQQKTQGGKACKPFIYRVFYACSDLTSFDSLNYPICMDIWNVFYLIPDLPQPAPMTTSLTFPTTEPSNILEYPSKPPSKSYYSLIHV